jgi:hypothetical protein
MKEGQNHTKQKRGVEAPKNSQIDLKSVYLTFIRAYARKVQAEERKSQNVTQNI